MVQKEGKRSFEGFRGIIILLILAKAQSLSLSLGQALHLGQACQLPGHHSSCGRPHYTGCIAESTAGTRARGWQAQVGSAGLLKST